MKKRTLTLAATILLIASFVGGLRAQPADLNRGLIVKSDFSKYESDSSELTHALSFAPELVVEVGGSKCTSNYFNGWDACLDCDRNYFSGLKEFSISIWIKPQRLSGKRADICGQLGCVELFHQASKIKLKRGLVPENEYSSAPVLEQGKWYHIVAICTEKLSEVFVNGEKLISETGSFEPSGGQQSVRIGGFVNEKYKHYFMGAIDDARFYKRGLTKAEVKLLLADCGTKRIAVPPDTSKKQVATVQNRDTLIIDNQTQKLTAKSILLHTDSLRVATRTRLYTYSADSELQKMRQLKLTIDTALFRALADSIAGFRRQHSAATDTLRYLHILQKIKENVVNDVRNKLAELFEQPPTAENNHIIELLQAMLLEIEMQNAVISNEIVLLQARLTVLDAQLAKSRLRVLLAIVVISLFLIIIIGLVVMNINKRKHNIVLQKTNRIVSEQKEEITLFNETIIDKNRILQQQHDDIEASIAYARKIQSALLPEMQDIKNAFSESFVFYRPKDVVSGDFYWFRRVKNICVLAVADCTGHGIPGGFMSALGISLLNEIVTKTQMDSPAEVLEKLRKKIKFALKQTGEYLQSKDGMDIALCIIDTETLALQYAGAYLPLYLVRHGEMTVIKGNRQPVGIYPEETNFVDNSVQLAAGDVLYLCSDGYADQLGGLQYKKYKTANLKKLLLEVAPLSMPEQEWQIEHAFEAWKREYIQTDDILVVGLRVE